MNRKKLVVGIAGGAAALSLLGAGVGASFTDKASAAQSITRGSINLLLSTNGTDFGKNVTFTDPGPVGSGAQTINETLTIANAGNLPVHLTGALLSESGPAMGLTATYPSFGTQPVNVGDNLIPANAITIPANGSVQVPITWTLPAAADNSSEGAVSSALLVIHGTD